MSGTYLGLPASLWVCELGNYLNTAELLTLRLLDKAANQFVLFVLFPQRVTLLSNQLETLKSAPKTEDFLQFQNLLIERDALANSPAVFARSLAEVSSFPNPPHIVYTVCNLLARIATGEFEEVPWRRCLALFKNTRFWLMFVEKLCKEEVDAAWLLNLETSAAGITQAQVHMSSKSSSDVLTLVMSFLRIHRTIAESTEIAKTVFEYERKVKNDEKEMKTAENVAKIAAGERRLGGWNYSSLEEMKAR